MGRPSSTTHSRSVVADPEPAAALRKQVAVGEARSAPTHDTGQDLTTHGPGPDDKQADLSPAIAEAPDPSFRFPPLPATAGEEAATLKRPRWSRAAIARPLTKDGGLKPLGVSRQEERFAS